MKLTCRVNGKSWSGTIHPLKRLLDVLREDMGLTGTKEGCGEGECGACTVILDGKPVMSCLVPACQADGARVETIEGLCPTPKKSAVEPKLHPMQEAFVEEGGAQCGICTPGMIMASVAYQRDKELAENWGEALAGNLCRCTGYMRIFESVKRALKK